MQRQTALLAAFAHENGVAVNCNPLIFIVTFHPYLSKYNVAFLSTIIGILFNY